MTLRESFIHKGITPYVVLRRFGMVARIKKKTGWKTAEGLEITKIDFLSYHGQGCVDELEEI